MSLLPGDIALTLSRDAREHLQACSLGRCWVREQSGTALELQQVGLVQLVQNPQSGVGYVLLLTNAGRDVARTISDQAN